MEKLAGTLERITFYSEETCYLVGRLRVAGKKELLTIVGALPVPVAGERLDLTGEWTLHPAYGKQFKIEKFVREKPGTPEAIEKYLASGVIKGIGPATAKLFCKYFGKEILQIIESEPQRLTEVPGIGRKKADTIATSFKTQQEMQEVILFFQEYDVSPSYAARIYRYLKEKTMPLVRENPYRLAEEVYGIGFKTADMIACKMGLDLNSPQRVRASLTHLLSKASEEGHVFLPQEELLTRALELLESEEKTRETLHDLVMEQIVSLKEQKIIICEKKEPETDLSACDAQAGEEYCYLAPFFFSERGVATRLKKLNSAQIKLEAASPDKEIKYIEKNSTITLAPRQKEALREALKAGVIVVTGGPGTGKTTTIKALLELFRRFHLEVMLAAPTGRAAKRMTEATGKEAKTLHRLLEYTKGKEGFYFKRNQENPLKAHVVIVDEVSMVDLLLMYNLLKAVPAGCKLVLVGDKDQLPSVGAGNVLRDIIDSGVVSVVRLETIFRQARDSAIILNAHRVNQGEFPYRNNKEGDFFFLKKEDPSEILALILDLCSRRLPQYQKYNPLEDIQVLTPMRRTILGVDNLNQTLQEHLNPVSPAKPEFNLAGITFRLGDKVMQIKNNYELEVFNGDIGKITLIDREENQVIIAYPDLQGYREVIYDFKDMEEVVLAYATSVHKSQGSEYKVVILPVVTQHFIMLQRNLIYTAITRAKEMVILIGTTRALAIAIKNNKVEERYTLLAERLKR